MLAPILISLPLSITPRTYWLQLEIAVRKTNRPDLIKQALAKGWDDEMNWQAELQSADVPKIYDAMELYTENGELMR